MQRFNLKEGVSFDDVMEENEQGKLILYVDLRHSKDYYSKSAVEEMLADAMGVSKEVVWAELGTRIGFGKKLN